MNAIEKHDFRTLISGIFHFWRVGVFLTACYNVQNPVPPFYPNPLLFPHFLHPFYLLASNLQVEGGERREKGIRTKKKTVYPL